MVQDIQECMNIIKEFIFLNINTKYMILGHSLYGYYSHKTDTIEIMSDGRLLLKIGNITLKIGSKDEFNNACEVLLDQKYNYYINNERKDIVLDVGMKIGDTTLYFLHKKNVEKVYGYELFEEKYTLALENLSLFLHNNEKLEVSQYEISNENEQIKDQKVSSIFAPIIEKYPLHNIVLKMDYEGEKYGILEDLLQSGILSKITFIMLEGHYKSKETILKCLKQAGFSWWCNSKNDDIELIYAYKG